MAHSKSKKIAVVGLWHLGSVYAVAFAKMGFEVIGIDSNTDTIKRFNEGEAPIFEPDLEDTLKRHKKNIRFSTDIRDLRDCQYIFVTHDVEVDTNDRADLSVIKKIFTGIARYAHQEAVTVISSQIPVGTSRILVQKLQKKGVTTPKVIYFPENLRLGTAFDSFFNPDRVILGSDSSFALAQFSRDFAFTCPVLTMNLESAEMVKHALNSYLATCISWSSEISDLAENVGAYMPDVVKALKTEKRVSPFAPISPGLGFAGGTLGRDVQALRGLGQRLGHQTKFFNAVYGVNRDRLPMLLKKIKKVYPTLKNKSIGLLGLTYKPHTSTLRRSMSLELARLLKREGVMVKAYDPMISGPVPGAPYITACTTVDDFFEGLDMVILMNESNEFQQIDPKRVATHMRKRVLVDTKNFLEADVWHAQGFTYVGMGVPSEMIQKYER